MSDTVEAYRGAGRRPRSRQDSHFGCPEDRSPDQPRDCHLYATALIALWFILGVVMLGGLRACQVFNRRLM
jgi:hypothetical protein